MSAPKRSWPLRPAQVLAAVATVWLLALVFLVWPALRDSRRNTTEISALSAHIETLGGWSSGRALLAADANQWEQELDTRFQRLFPPERRLQDLFLQIAAAANSSGVDPVQLRTLQPEGESGRGQLRPADQDPAGLANLLEALDLSIYDLPSSDLRALRLRLSFDADYASLARFGDAMRHLERALCIKSLRVRPGSQGVAVDMELEYYVQAGN